MIHYEIVVPNPYDLKGSKLEAIKGFLKLIRDLKLGGLKEAKFFICNMLRGVIIIY